MLEFNPEHINEPYLSIAKECLNSLAKEDLPIERVNNVISCINYLIRFSSIIINSDSNSF